MSDPRLRAKTRRSSIGTQHWIDRSFRYTVDSSPRSRNRNCPQRTIERKQPMFSTRRIARHPIFRLMVVLGLAAGGASALAQGPATVVPQPRQGAWMEKHQSFLKQAQAGNVDLLFLGDSITQGWNGGKETWNRYYAPRKAANFGIGGDKTEHVLDRKSVV